MEKMTAKKALSLGLTIKQSKRFLRVKKSMIAVFNSNKHLTAIDNIRKIVENSKFELDFNYFGSNYVLSSDGVKYVNFDIMVGENLGVGLIDYKDFIGTAISRDVSSRVKLKHILYFLNLCHAIGDAENSNICYALIHSLSLDLKEERSEKVIFRNFQERNDFDLTFIEGRKNKKNIPDAWVVIDGKECPVEAKRYEFTKKSLIQLQRYMKEFGAENGVAVASKLSVELPSNIFFYNINGKKEN